jgi:hypothetical protein
MATTFGNELIESLHEGTQTIKASALSRAHEAVAW